jgi:hypothetical protein
MHELAVRFNFLQGRFMEFSEKVPALLRDWLSKQDSVTALVSLGGLADQLFPIDDESRQWVVTIACSALSDHLSRVPHVQCNGSSVIFSNIPATLSVEWPTQANLHVRPTDDEMTLRRRNAFLEVRVAELETKAVAPGLPKYPVTPAPIRRFATSEDTHLFLLEKRFEAEDAIAVLRRMQTEHIGRSFLVDSIGKDQARKFREKARMDAKKARQELATAVEEIVRLGREVESLRSSAKSTQVDACPIVPKRALIIAGFWDVSHNDVLRITPHLVERFENAGKRAIKRKDSQVCFPAKDRETVISVVVQVMAEMLPHYKAVE